MVSAKVLLPSAERSQSLLRTLACTDALGSAKDSARLFCDKTRRQNSAAQHFGGVFGEVSEDNVGPGALYGNQRLHYYPVTVHPVLLRGGLDHGVLARDLVGSQRR